MMFSYIQVRTTAYMTAIHYSCTQAHPITCTFYVQYS
uniref:Uncharacterized protein n=1 Tax=Setaria italica TaxID=4555 RepID=K4AP14_SETIT